MSNIFYTSDLHIGHARVSELRGFETTDAHDAAVAAQWDRQLSPDDTVWILGDISINGSQKALDWVAARPGHKVLVAGNHDPVHPSNRKAIKLLPHWHNYFDAIVPFARRKLNGHDFLLQHFPYWPNDRGEPRYEQYRLPDLGLPLLHGHTHSHFAYEFPRSLHVGWDAWGELVPQDLVQGWLDVLAD